MSKKFKLVRATVLALQIITVALRVHDAFIKHDQCVDVCHKQSSASNLTSTDPDTPIRRLA